MTSSTYDVNPSSRVKLFALVASAYAIVATAARSVVSPHTASLKRLWDIPLTLVGFACIDYAAFLVAHPLGWLVTGLSVITVEHMIADGDE